MLDPHREQNGTLTVPPQVNADKPKMRWTHDDLFVMARLTPRTATTYTLRARDVLHGLPGGISRRPLKSKFVVV